MKLKFERFEGLAVFSIRGLVAQPALKLLQVGLETIAKDLEESLLINLTYAQLRTEDIAFLAGMKAHLPRLTKQKTYWISTLPSIADFKSVKHLVMKLNQSQVRIVGERVILDDEVYALQGKVLDVQAKFDAIGDQDHAHQMILEHRQLKEQERILKSSLQWQHARHAAQKPVPTDDADIQQKKDLARTEIEKIYGPGVDL